MNNLSVPVLLFEILNFSKKNQKRNRNHEIASYFISWRSACDQIEALAINKREAVFIYDDFKITEVLGHVFSAY